MSLYSFTSHTFTNADATGRFGPALSAVRSAYSSAAWANNFLNMAVDNGIQLWTVPTTGMYTIRAAGAAGAYANSNGGRGIDISTTTELTKGKIIKILVGQKGGALSTSSGGGGTFIILENTPPTAILVAGGGGGAYSDTTLQVSIPTSNASANTGGNNGAYSTTFLALGGTNGSGGEGGVYGGGGGGFTGDGADSLYSGTANSGGISFVNGGTGGDHSNYAICVGGFGGGGGTHGNTGGGGGGGGYSGGGACAVDGVDKSAGGGGGSYAISTMTENGYNTGHGSVIIILIVVTTAADYESTFTSHTFTNAGATGRTGPTLSTVRTAYSTVVWAQDTTNNWLNMSGNNGIQLWTVPKTGSYIIGAAGAMGGGNMGAGLGAYIRGKFSLTKGNVIRILVGQIGGQETYDVGGGIYSGGGGGGTFVVLENGNAALIIAGGGGGRSRVAAYNASNNETDTFTGIAGNAGANNAAYGGAGLNENSYSSISHTSGIIAFSYANGGVGGLGSPDGGQGFGGFGGGGGEGYADGGGGGGYSGGNAGDEGLSAGGGGSFFNTTIGSSRTNNTGNSGQGFVTITLLPTTPATLTFVKTAFYAKYVLNSTFSIPAALISTNNTDSYTVAHSSGNAGIATVSTAANAGTVTVKGLGTTTITSTLSATANFDAITVSSITITVIGSGSTVTGATMTSVDLTSTDLTGSVFSGCDLTSANLNGAIFNVNTDLRGSTLTSLRSGNIIGYTTLLPTGYKMI